MLKQIYSQKFRADAILVAAVSLLLPGLGIGGADVPGSPGYNLVWEDAFDGTGINPKSWEHEVMPGVASGNNELQFYTDREVNSFIREGCLVIRALKEEYRKHDYTSAKIRTANKHDYRFGRIEARMKLPSGQGLWPAFWMLPTEAVHGLWPLSGEIDIVESGNQANRIHGTIHFGTPTHVFQGDIFPKKQELRHVDFSSEFHIYTLIWEPTLIRWLIDGEEYGRQTRWTSAIDPFPAPFDQTFHLILNLAVGGNWPGPPGESTTFPQELVVDWVRVYQMNNREPAIRIVTPESKAHLQAGTDVRVLAEASDPDGKVERVIFYKGKDLVGECRQTPFEVRLKEIEEGCHKITCVVLDDLGMIAKDTVNLIVGAGCPPGPFRGKPLEVPGRLEAEWFDEGVEGEAYHDTDRFNKGHSFRPLSGVDIENCSEGGFCLGWLEAGEWVEYSIYVRESGQYKIVLRVAAPEEGGEAHLGFGENPESISVRIPKTGGWQTYELSAASGVHLNQGEQRMRLVVDRPGFNLSYIEIQK